MQDLSQVRHSRGIGANLVRSRFPACDARNTFVFEQKAMPSAEEHYDRGVDLFAEGRYDDAIAAYSEALAVDPGFVDALHGLAMAHAEKGELDAAIAAAKRITEASPDDPLGYTSVSMLYQRAGQIAEAETAANQARVLEWKQQLTKP